MPSFSVRDSPSFSYWPTTLPTCSVSPCAVGGLPAYRLAVCRRRQKRLLESYYVSLYTQITKDTHKCLHTNYNLYTRAWHRGASFYSYLSLIAFLSAIARSESHPC